MYTELGEKVSKRGSGGRTLCRRTCPANSEITRRPHAPDKQIVEGERAHDYPLSFDIVSLPPILARRGNEF